MSMRPIRIPLGCLLYVFHQIYPTFMLYACYCLHVRRYWRQSRIRTGREAYQPALPVDAAFGEFMLETTAFMWFTGTEKVDGYDVALGRNEDSEDHKQKRIR